jgi:hypothetical protein
MLDEFQCILLNNRKFENLHITSDISTTLQKSASLCLLDGEQEEEDVGSFAALGKCLVRCLVNEIGLVSVLRILLILQIFL